MFITRKRHEREKWESFGVNSPLSEAVLRHVPQGVFLIDARDRIIPPVSRSLTVLFRRQDFANLGFDRLLKPIVSAQTLGLARTYLKSLHSPGTMAEIPAANPLKDVEVRLVNPDGSFDTAHYGFEFNGLDTAAEPGMWMVRVSDITARVQQARELEDLRAQLRIHGEVLRAMMRMGSARLGGALQRIDSAMLAIDLILKKPAREQDAFRTKLEETLEEVDRVRRESVTLKFTALEAAARGFEDALHDLRNRAHLSGNDFLPLAVTLDDMSSQFSQVRSLLASRDPSADAGGKPADHRAATAVMEAPDFDAPPAAAPGGEASPGASSDDAVTVRTASPAGAAIATEASAEPAAARPAAAKPAKTPPSGNLAASLIELTDVIALESQKAISLECIGLHAVPAHYQTTVKNIAIQLIRNAVTHGIESADERLRAGKSAQGHLRLEFNATAAGTFDLMFEDDGRGLDPELVRKTAVARGLLDADAAAKMRDRQAIKLIFKSGFTTVRTGNAASGDTGRGSGLAVVRRHVHQAGGRIALASLPGHETRFKISMPSVPESAVEAQVA